MKRPPVIHPFLIAIFPILFLYSHNLGQVSFYDILLPLAASLSFTFAAILALRGLLKDDMKAGLVMFIFLALFFSYGHAYNFIYGLRVGDVVISRYRYLAFLWIALFICAAYFTMRTNRSLNNLTRSLNIITCSLVAVNLAVIGCGGLKSLYDREAYNKKGVEISEKEKTGFAGTSYYPDIYYIILDSYASSSTLKEDYGYDNHEFVDYLEKRGFYVAFRSASNYHYTYLSLASSLNMEYINSLSRISNQSSRCVILAEMVKNNKAKNFLKSKGYKFINLGSRSVITNYNWYADVNMQPGVTNEFLAIFLRTTMLRPLEGFLGYDARKRVLDAFAMLGKAAKIKGPKFVFAHFDVPHPPYIFGPNGEYVAGAASGMPDDAEKERKMYLNQLIFTTKKTEALIDEILSGSERPPVIILQGDHGPVSMFNDDGMVLRPDVGMSKRRMRILNAYYLPGMDKKILYESITPINTFRVIFNLYFGASFDLLDDRVYYQLPDNKFMDVTDLIHD